MRHGLAIVTVAAVIMASMAGCEPVPTTRHAPVRVLDVDDPPARVEPSPPEVEIVLQDTEPAPEPEAVASDPVVSQPADRPVVTPVLGMPEQNYDVYVPVEPPASEPAVADPDPAAPDPVLEPVPEPDRIVIAPDLTITDVRLCRSVRGFDDVDAFEQDGDGRYPMLAGVRHPVIVYTQLANYTSAHELDDRWQTEVSIRLVLRGPDGAEVWRDDWRSIVDSHDRQRDEFYVTCVVTLPATTSVGIHELEVEARDDARDVTATTRLQILLR